ncbi:hypothetical protein [Embleya sp. AB8]|uniref:hypothetical protein n=1 Tax=Embleya sp. AB8 TaxID=3156304 RepID=UPI003C757420
MKLFGTWLGRMTAALALMAGSVVLFSGPAQAGTTESVGTRGGLNVRFVCGNSPVPAPWVVIAQGRSNNCGGSVQMTITDTITDGMTVCFNSKNIPLNWVTVSASQSQGCGNLGLLITGQLRSPMDVCANSTIPDGWVVVGQGHSPYCGGYSYETITKF